MSRIFERDRYPEEVVGTLYKAVRRGQFNVGELVVLIENDGTSCPLFKLKGTRKDRVCYEYWDYLKPYSRENIIGGKLLTTEETL